MDQLLNRWWLLALRGAAAIIFGILTFVAPFASLFALVIVYGVYALVDGALFLTLAIRGARRKERWGSLFVAGLAGIAAGVVTFVWPRITALALVYVIAFWAIVMGVASLAAAVRLRKQVDNEWLLGLSGALAVIFGIVLAVFPGAGALAVVMWIGAGAIVLGGVLVALAFRLRAIRDAHAAPTGALPTPA